METTELMLRNPSQWWVMEFKAMVKTEPQIYEAGGFSMPKRFVMVFVPQQKDATLGTSKE